MNLDGWNLGVESLGYCYVNMWDEGVWKLVDWDGWHLEVETLSMWNVGSWKLVHWGGWNLEVENLGYWYVSTNFGSFRPPLQNTQFSKGAKWGVKPPFYPPLRPHRKHRVSDSVHWMPSCLTVEPHAGIREYRETDFLGCRLEIWRLCAHI